MTMQPAKPHFQQMHPLIFYEDPSAQPFVHMPMLAYSDVGQHGSANVHHYSASLEPALMPTDQAALKRAKMESTTNDELSAEVASGRRQAPLAGEEERRNSREQHNDIERRRRLRIRQCCELLRAVVPGVSERTDKAAVLEQTARFVSHLAKCPNFKCCCEIESRRQAC